jgi:hypothetical protein
VGFGGWRKKSDAAFFLYCFENLVKLSVKDFEVEINF